MAGRSSTGGLSALQLALSTEADRGTLFLFVPILLAAGSLAYFTAPSEPAFFIVALIVVLGVSFAKLENLARRDKVLGGEISTRLTGRVELVEHQANGRTRLTIDVIATELPQLRYAPERVRVSARKVSTDIVAGSEIIGIVRLRPPTGPVRPDSYDFSFESYFDGIGANGFFLSGSDLVETPEAPGPMARFSASVENIRVALAERIWNRIGGVEGEKAAALLVGVRAGVSEPVNEALRRTRPRARPFDFRAPHGACCGNHRGDTARRLRVFPDFSSRRPVKKCTASAALAAIAAYLFISGSAVAAERGFVMLAVMLTALLFDRAALTMRNLAIASLAIIVWSPHEVVGPSFQMSFAATAALIGTYAWWSNRQEECVVPTAHLQGSLAYRIVRKGLYYAAGLALTSLIAGTATTVYGAYHFQRVSPLSLLANLAAMPFGLDGPIFDLTGKASQRCWQSPNGFRNARRSMRSVSCLPVPSWFSP